MAATDWGHFGTLAAFHGQATVLLDGLRVAHLFAPDSSPRAYYAALKDAERRVAQTVDALARAGNEAKAKLNGGNQVPDLKGA